MEILKAILLIALLGLLAAISYIDTKTRQIPDVLVAGIAALGIVNMIITASTGLAWSSHLLGSLAASLPLLACALLFKDSLGFGDVKLMAAAGLFLGWQLVVVALATGILVGGVYALYLLVVKQKGRKQKFAFGPALCLGIALSAFMGQPLINWYGSLL